MEALLKTELKTSTLKSFGSGGGGCISTGQCYRTDHGEVFVKMNDKSGARGMFDGEIASLKAIAATETLRVPKPIKVLDKPGGGAMLVMEYLDMRSLSRHSEHLGQQLARLHLHNEEVGLRLKKQESSVHKDQDVEYMDQFGFHIPTCCGFIPQANTWHKDWVTYYIGKLQEQIDLVEQKSHDREAKELWQNLMPKIAKLFEGIEVKPSLLHGDLWGGNAAETADGPVIYDAASFYGHHEYDLGIAYMFGGFGESCFNAYHKQIPKAPGFQQRNQLYQLFHYLNHWNHFGGGYRGQSVSIMKQLSKS